MAKSNLHDSRKSFELNGKTYNYYRLAAIEEAGIANISRLPYSVKVLLESVLRQHDGYVIKDDHVNNLARWGQNADPDAEVPFKPSNLCAYFYSQNPKWWM